MTDVEIYRLLGRIEATLTALDQRLSALEERLASPGPRGEGSAPGSRGPGLHFAYGGARVSASLSKAGAMLLATFGAWWLGFLDQLIELARLYSTVSPG